MNPTWAFCGSPPIWYGDLTPKHDAEPFSYYSDTVLIYSQGVFCD